MFSSEFSDIIKYLDIACKTLQMYSENHPRTQQAVERTFTALSQTLETRESMTISIAEGNLLLDGQPVEKGNPVIDRFARDLFSRNIHSLNFVKGVTLQELNDLLRQLNLKPQRIRDLGGFEKILQDAGVKNVHANKVKYGIITDEEIGGLDQELLSQLLLAVQTTLAGDTNVNATAADVERSLDSASSQDPAGLLFRIFQMIAQTSPALPEDEAASTQPLKEHFVNLFRSFGPSLQGKLLLAAILKSSGMDKSALKDFYHELTPEELESSMLSLLDQPISGDELANLFGAMEREGQLLTEPVRKRMEELGFLVRRQQQVWEEILNKESLSPEDLQGVPEILEQTLVQERLNETDLVSKKVFACLSLGSGVQKIAAVRMLSPIVKVLSKNEKWKNVDFSLSLLVSTCFRKETDPEVLTALLDFLIDSFRVNFLTGNFLACHDLLAAIRHHAGKQFLIQELAARIALQPDLFLDGIRQGAEGSEAIFQYLKLCGEKGIESLFDWLAEEEDQHSRARLIAHITAFRKELVLQQIEKRITDTRWFIVRNLITILGKMTLTESPPFLQKAAGHPDSRVVKEIVKNLFKSSSKADEPVILQLLHHADKSIRMQAIHLGTNLNLTGMIPILLKYAGSLAPADTDLRALTFQALLKLRVQEAVPLALLQLEKKAPNKAETPERNAAVKILGELNRAQARPVLERIAQLDPYPETRALAAAYL